MTGRESDRPAPESVPSDVALIDEQLARKLVDEQFPQWAGLPVGPVERSGIDNRTLRLGSEMTIRLPSGEWYALQVEKEQQWLPVLAPQLPLPIPAPVAQGIPGAGYPYPWSVYRWLDGENATAANIDDLTEFAVAVAGFLRALQRVDSAGGPGPGRHNFYRGGPLAAYAEETTATIKDLGDEVPSGVLALWDDAMTSAWLADPVWFHGDIAIGSLLVRDRQLAAVIDFGTCGVGDPACDTVIAWTLFSGRSREAFRRTLGVDAGTWSRGRGWALWKALITLLDALERDPSAVADSRLVIDRVLADRAQEA